MLRFCDFVPFYKLLADEGVFSDQVEQAGTFTDAVRIAGEWIRDHGIKPLQIETVVLPNMWQEQGSHDVALRVQTGHPRTSSRWHQFIRVWYDDEPPPAPYR